MNTGKIEIDITAGGVGTIRVDGKDVSAMVSGANIRIRAGKLTRVILVMAADVAVETEGMVTTSTVDGYTRHKKVAS